MCVSLLKGDFGGLEKSQKIGDLGRSREVQSLGAFKEMLGLDSKG